MNIEVLEESFALLEPYSQEFAISFYQSLFKAYPQVEHLFERTNIEKQAEKLMQSLKLIVFNIRYINNLKIILKNLGCRHLTYQVDAKHYELVGSILLQTMKTYLNSAWTKEVEETWIEAYEVIVDLMLEGSKKEYPSYKGKPVKQQIHHLKMKALIHRNLSLRNSTESIIDNLENRPYFQEAVQKLGRKKMLQLISDAILEVKK